MDIATKSSPASELLTKAQVIAKAVAARVAEADQMRDVPAATIAEMKAADLFRAFQPTEWGGFELDPTVVLDIQNIFAQACASTAWVYGVLSVQSFLLGRFSQQAQADVWENDGRALLSSSFQPAGIVTPVHGGFNIRGRWTYSSGSTHCGWAVLGGLVPPADQAGPPTMRLFLVPRADYEIIDTWQVIGLRGTGSNDILVDGAFVPAHRTYQPDAGLLPLSGSSLPLLYRLPWLYVFTSMISNLGIGMGRGAVEAFIEMNRAKLGNLANPPMRELQAVARMSAEIDGSELIARRNIERLRNCVAAGDDLPLSEALLYRTQLTAMMRRIAVLADELMLLSGAKGIRLESPLSRIWLDFSAARAHLGNDPFATQSQLATGLVTAMTN